MDQLVISCLSFSFHVELNHCLYLLLSLHGQQKSTETILRADFVNLPQYLLIYSVQDIGLKGSVPILKGLKVEIQFSLDDLILKCSFLYEPLRFFLQLKLQKKPIIGLIEPPNSIDNLRGSEILSHHLHINRLL